MELAEIVMNPVRQRIFQYFLLHETGTVKEIRKALPDVPSASLYRHIKILTDSTILMVVGENRIRGTVESVYQLNKDAMTTEDETGNAVQMSLLSICASFAKYFSSGKADPKKDIRDLSGICNYYPAWDHTYSISDIDEKINAAEHIISTLDQQVQTILEIDRATDITIITNLVCERLKMPYLKENPLFRKTVLAHCLNYSNYKTL